MPSRQAGKYSRLPSIAAKMAGIRGLTFDEKGMLTRIGNLVDTLMVAERNLSNAGEGQARVFSTKVPTPTNITANVLLGGIEVTWDAVEFNKFAFYEIQHDSSATFATPTTFPVYTNRTIIKGFSGNVINIRVRTVDIDGLMSQAVATGNITVSTTIFDLDTDYAQFENRTRIAPQPKLLGKDITVETGNSKALVGVGGAVGPSSLSIIDISPLTSVSFDGSSESLRKTTGVALGITDTYSVMIWVKGTDFSAGSETFIDFRVSGADNSNRFQISHVVSGQVRVFVWNDVPAELKQFRYNGASVDGSWRQYVAVVDPTLAVNNQLRLYVDGVLTTPDTLTTNGDVSGAPPTDSPGRGIYIATSVGGAYYAGNVHTAAIWGTALSAAEVKAIWNKGSARGVDLATSSGDYASSDDLQHWWRLGHDDTDIGADYGSASTLIDVMDDAESITAADDVKGDHPGVPTIADPQGPTSAITYKLSENDATVQTRTMGLPTYFYEGVASDTETERIYTSFPGSFVDFYSIETLNQDPDALDIEFLDYLTTDHLEQSGIVNNASMSIMKF